MNGTSPEGASAYRINTSGGRRMHSARACLAPALRRQNVTLMTGVMVARIGFDGRRATRVEVTHKGRAQSLHARREIILSAGAVSSPRLLQLSGIGPADMLQEHGITPLMNAPHVGVICRITLA